MLLFLHPLRPALQRHGARSLEPLAMPQIIHGECANGGGGGGGGASPPATQASPTLGPWPPGGRVPVNDNNIDLPADSSDNVLHPRRRAAPGHDCRAEASAAGWESTASSSSSPNSAVTSSPNSAVTSSSSRLSLPPLSSAVASSSSPPAVPLSSSSPSPNYAITSSTSFQNSVSANAMFLILYGVASLMLSLVLVRWSYDIESHATPAHTNTTVHSVIILTAMLQLCMSRVQSNLDHWRWIGPELCWVVLLITGSKDIVSAGLPGSAPRYGLMNRIVTMTASLLGLLLFSACSFGISDLMFNLITKGKNLVPAIHLILVLAFLFAASDLMFNLSTGNNLVSAIHLKLASWCRYLNRKLVMVVSLLVLLLLALVFWGIHLPSDNSLAMKRGNEIKMVNNHQHSPERMLLSINHDTQGNVGKDDGIINDVLRMTTGNADGSVENQKAFPHWTSNQNKSIRQDYEEKRELQIVPGKSHLSAHKMIKTVVASSIAVASALVVVCYIFVLLWRKCGNRARIIVPLAPQLELCSRVTGCSRAFKYEELAAATNNFTDENKLGHGGFGPVYRGLLRDPDRHVAIKLLSAESSWQGQTEFEAEVNVLSQVRHRNIVQLVGWCQSNEGLLLVYELMAEGSLDKHLHNPVRILSWQQRYKIILDLGSALIYLHQCCDKCIVHGDIKPENVMLDASYNAKLGDFGTARLLEHGAEPRATEIVAGTRGYIDPEFVNNQMRCPEADMYSFGVALLEIASGKRPASRQPGEASALLVWVRHLYDQRRVLDAADGKMNGEFDRQQMERVLVTGLWCAHQDPSQRPFTEQAMDVLRSADASMPVLPATRDPQRVRILEEQAYGDLTGEGASVDAVAASTCYLTSKDDSAYLLAEE